MQSPHKLQARLSELMAPPGPDADPMELTLRSIVAMTGPAIMNIVSQMTPEALDDALEDVAVWFLAMRSDAAPFSLRFARALGELEAGQEPDLPVLTAGPDPTPGSSAPAAPPSSSPAPQAPAPDPAAPAPGPSPAGAPATDASPSSSTTTAPSPPPSTAPAAPDAPAPAAPSTDAPASSGSSSDTAPAADPASGTPASEQPPAPPWG